MKAVVRFIIGLLLLPLWFFMVFFAAFIEWLSDYPDWCFYKRMMFKESWILRSVTFKQIDKLFKNKP